MTPSEARPYVVEITLPRLGETMEGAEVVAWLKGVGERVARGEALFEVQTDKVTVEVPALRSGVLRDVLVSAGEVAEVGQVVARLEVADEAGKGGLEAPAATPPVPEGATDTRERSEERALPAPVPMAPAQSAPAQSVSTQSVPTKVRASPAARRLARELGVDLRALAGSGPRGRVTGEDVRRAAGLYPLTRLERASGRVAAQGWAAPHFYVRRTADATRLAARLQASPVTLTAALALACARTLARHPRLNATLEGEGVRLHPRVHLGVFTATPEGLAVAVVADAEALSLEALDARLKEVCGRVAAGRAAPDEVTGATFCVSNLGMYDVDEFSAVLPPGNAAVLAVGALREAALVEGGALRFAKTLRLTVSADHRALDGVAVASFLRDLCATLQEPESLFGGKR